MLSVVVSASTAGKKNSPRYSGKSSRTKLCSNVLVRASRHDTLLEMLWVDWAEFLKGSILRHSGVLRFRDLDSWTRGSFCRSDRVWPCIRSNHGWYRS